MIFLAGDYHVQKWINTRTRHILFRSSALELRISQMFVLHEGQCQVPKVMHAPPRLWVESPEGRGDGLGEGVGALLGGLGDEAVVLQYAVGGRGGEARLQPPGRGRAAPALGPGGGGCDD